MKILLIRMCILSTFFTMCTANVFSAQGRTNEVTINYIKMYDPQNGDRTRTAGEVVGTVRSTKQKIWDVFVDFANLKKWVPRTTYRCV